MFYFGVLNELCEPMIQRPVHNEPFTEFLNESNEQKTRKDSLSVINNNKWKE